MIKPLFAIILLTGCATTPKTELCNHRFSKWEEVRQGNLINGDRVFEKKRKCWVCREEKGSWGK